MTVLGKIIAAAGLSVHTTGKIQVERTGNIYSVAGSEFKITYPDGKIEKVWSSPWHTMSPEMEQLGAMFTGLKIHERFMLDYLRGSMT